MLHYALVLSLLTGCADPFGDAKKADTIEAWEQFLSTGPGGTDKMMAEKRLEDLLVKRAEESKKLEDYDGVLKRFPKSKKKKEMQAGRANAAFAIAEAEGTVEGWEKFLKKNDFADGALKKRAGSMLEVARYASSLAIAEPVVQQVNLADDPKGALDGWGVSTEVTNNADKTFDFLTLEVQFLDAQGKKVQAASYPLVGQAGPGGMSLEEQYKPPLAPGDKRAWRYTTGDVPEGWNQQVRVVPIAIRVADDAAKAE